MAQSGKPDLNEIKASIGNIEKSIDQGNLNAENVKDFLSTLINILKVTESTEANALLIGLIRKAVGKNIPGSIRLDFLSSLSHAITSKNPEGDAVHSTATQKSIIELSQSAFDAIWQANHLGKASLTEEECQEYSILVPRMTDVLNVIDTTNDLELQASILKLCLGAFKATTSHIEIPSSESGKHLKEQIQGFISSLADIMSNHESEWKKASQPVTSGKKVAASLAGAATLVGGSVPSSIFALTGGILGAAVGIVAGAARLTLGVSGTFFVEVNPLTNSAGGFSGTKEMVRRGVSSPLRNAQRGIIGGWETVDPKNLAYRVYEGICNHEREQTKTRSATATKLRSMVACYKKDNKKHDQAK